MKIINTRIGLSSFLIVLTVTIFLISCERAEVINIDPQKQTEFNGQQRLVLPIGIATESEKARDKYIENASPEELDKMIENGRVVDYLQSINKLEDTATKLAHGEYFSDFDFNSNLTELEILELQDYENSIESRSCICCRWVYINFCKPPHGDCDYWDWQCYWCC